MAEERTISSFDAKKRALRAVSQAARRGLGDRTERSRAACSFLLGPNTRFWAPDAEGRQADTPSLSGASTAFDPRSVPCPGEVLAKRGSCVSAHDSGLPEHRVSLAQSVVCWYVSFAYEVETWDAIQTALGRGGKVVVPFCVEEHLGLWELGSFDELEPGRWGILEPPVTLRERWPERLVSPKQLDAVVVPGVAFDGKGNRLGYGKGYYDRLLAAVRPEALRIGLCFDCQVASEVPAAAHDQRMHYLITESGIAPCCPEPAPPV